ncbi:MFS transporter [Mucilaginibacter sp. PAMB04274]|uniref:MFS transporter n=1 Tax=Mucilaginibacter sp. PAMB04274 TaxID=3138568 RepID=UPI0031F66C11
MVITFSQIDRILPFILSESIKTKLRLNDTQLGIVSGFAFALCYALATLPLARIADMGRAKQVLFWCVCIWSLMTGFGGFANGFLLLALSRVGVALGGAGGTPASHALIGRRIPESFRGRALGLFSMGIPVGTVLGFALGGWANDHIGWRGALILAGGVGLVVALLAGVFVPKTPLAIVRKVTIHENFLQSSRRLLSDPNFLSLFIAANLLGFASGPFYAFTAAFLIRTHGLTPSQAGLSFVILQGLMDIAGTVLGGRLFDRAIKSGKNNLLRYPGIAFCVAAVSTPVALFAPDSRIAVILLVPAMFSFPFVLPHAFGAGHLSAGEGRQGLASALLMLGSSLLGSSLSPVLVGVISDMARNANIQNSLGTGLLLVPVFCLLTGISCFIAGRRVGSYSN